jgi:L-threonylcarbamoyladenylate synthase
MKILSPTKENIRLAASAIKSGGLVAFPTETVYGLGANGFDSIAVAKIFKAKNRPSFNPLILHLPSKSYLEKVTTCTNEKVMMLIENFLPGPLTLVLPKSNNVPEIVSAGNPTVGIRIPDNKIALDFISACEVPIAAPSANMFGMLSPTTAAHVADQLGERIDFIIDGGSCNVGVESTIIEFDGSRFYILRHGGLPVEKIESLLDEKLPFKSDAIKPNSPGQLKSHYAPRVPVAFIDEVNLEKINREKTGILVFSKREKFGKFPSEKVLSENGNLEEASANLFNYLHKFEEENLELILVEKVPEEGLGKAIMDRLIKATNRYK